jgi:hypothetical protein
VFLAATADGGPSADCCCDYLNFFTNTTTAHVWTRTHPHIPSQNIYQTDAQTLGTRLFGPLLSSS